MVGLFDVLLLSVLVVTLYLGPMVLRRAMAGRKTYGWMLIGDAVLAGLALAGLRNDPDDQIARLVGFVAVGGGVALVMVPPILRDAARRALAADRLRLAKFIVELREHLQPGMGGAQEAELIATIIEVRTGKVDAAIDRLRERRKSFANPLARRQIDERIVMTLLYARRWNEAIGEFEAGVGADFSSMSPQLMVDMVRAYCEAERLEAAAALVSQLEGSPLAEEPMLATLLNRSRLVFLAFVGRTGAVESIVGEAGPLAEMPQAARCFWSGIARLNAGDRSGARSSLSEAARLSARDSRARDLARDLISDIDAKDSFSPRVVTPSVAKLADRLSALAAGAKASPKTPRMSGVSIRRHVPVTFALIAGNLLVALVISTLFDSASDYGGLVRGGANIKDAVVAGQWWRLASSMFLHVGALHLFLNMYGLWVLGRLVEQMYGSARFFAVYMGAGVAGAVASVVLGGAGTSAGASGAVFGLLGAAITELALHRKEYPNRWRSALLGNLLFITVANVLIGFYATVIDQAAHIGGLLVGAVLAAMLSPKTRFGEALATRIVVAVLAVASAGAVVGGGVFAVTTSYGDTLASYQQVERTVGHLAVTVPSAWQQESDLELVDSGAAIYIRLGRFAAVDDVPAYLDGIVSKTLEDGGKESGFVRIAAADEPAMPIPEPWHARELIATDQSPIGDQRYRIVIFARAATGDGGRAEAWIGRLRYPIALTPDVQDSFSRLLSSARPQE